MTRLRLGLTVVLALGALGLSSSLTSANRLSVPGGRTTMTGSVTFFSDEEAGELAVTCNLTTVGSFNSTISKVRGASIGTMTSMVAGCAEEAAGPFVRFLSLPGVTFQLFLGTLPRIVGVLILLTNLEVLITKKVGFLTFRCLYRGNLGVLLSGGTLRLLEESTLTKVNAELTSFVCPNGGKARGLLGLTPTQPIQLI